MNGKQVDKMRQTDRCFISLMMAKKNPDVISTDMIN